MDHIKSEVNIEDIKSEHNFMTNQDYRGEEDVQKTIKNIYFAK